MTFAIDSLTGPIRRRAAGYSPDEHRPLSGYVAAMTAYAGLTGALAIAAWRKGLPDAVTAWDVALMGGATFELARTLAKDPVTSPLRAPFTEYAGVSAPSELHEEVRSTGPLTHSLGELVTCPFCLAQWVATALVAGLALSPRATRMAAATLSAVAVSDFLQYAYATAQKVSKET